MKNHLKEIKAAAGWPCGDNRNNVVRALNGLLDAGILELQFLSKDKVNEGFRYTYTSKDGKKRGTGYRIRLYGGRWHAGHRMPVYNRFHMMGVEHVDRITYQDIDAADIASRVATLMQLYRDKFNPYREMHARCAYCQGTGYKPQYAHICKGVCFKCGGSGIDMVALKQITQRTIMDMKPIRAGEDFDAIINSDMVCAKRDVLVQNQLGERFILHKGDSVLSGFLYMPVDPEETNITK